MNFGRKIIRVGDIATLRRNVGTQKIVVTGGCFDIFHYGHHHFLSRAKTKGDIVVVLLESDAFITERKKKKPVHTQMQRAEIVASLVYVDYVIVLDPMDRPDVEYRDIIMKIKPSVIAYSAGDTAAAKKQALARDVGATTAEIDFISSFSSSQLITYASILGD